MCRVAWFTKKRTSNGGYEYSMDPTSSMNRKHWFAPLADVHPMSVAVLPVIHDDGVGVRVENAIRRRAIKGPFDVINISRKTWM